MTTLHVYSNRHIKDQVKTIKLGDWVYLENGMSRKRWSRYFSVNNINEDSLDITYITREEYFSLTGIKFDVIIGNPPYQDGTKEGGQNKIYNLFCKKALTLHNSENSIVSFITPSSVLKESKRFSLIGQTGLKEVDFSTNNDFSEGVNICSWIVDSSYTGTSVKVTNADGTLDDQDVNDVIYDYSLVDKDFTKLYRNLKRETSTPTDRMFKQNNFGEAAVKEYIEGYNYTLHKIEDNKVVQTYYTRRTPYNNGEQKISIAMTKMLTEEAIYVGNKDFDSGYMTIAVKNQDEVDNIKSFILSPYFLSHCTKWKNLDGYGFNYGLKYLPKFDVTQSWTNNKVKEFIESYAR